MSKEENQNLLNSEDEDYDEEADEDFVLDASTTQKDQGSDSDSDSDANAEADAEVEIRHNKKYAELASDNGGLIKTRTQRAAEKLKENKVSIVKKTGSSPSKSDINSIWAELNNLGSKKVSSPSPIKTASQEVSSQKENAESKIENSNLKKSTEKIKIKRTYEFAGETITEEKLVDIDSQEAKAHLNSTTLISNSKNEKQEKRDSTIVPSNLRRKRKRASLLDAVISNSSKAKLSTLEKSRLDWASYVDENKINEELKYKNKNGYLEKQDFLNRVDNKQDQIMRQANKKH